MQTIPVDSEAPEKRALATCAKNSGQDCKLYSVDDYVVWQGPRMPPGSSDEGQLASTAVGGAGIGQGDEPH